MAHNLVKRLIALAAGVLVTLSFTSCEDSEEQKKLNKQYIETAKENAQDYIIQKYGFEAEITDAVQERRGAAFNFGTKPSSTVLVKMNYGGRDFGVYIDGSKSNTDGYDNYQAEDLEAAVQEECESLLPGIRSVSISSTDVHTTYEPIMNECQNMHREYFDGTNAADILSGAEINVCYVNADFMALQDTQLLDKYLDEDSTISFISYRSENALENGSMSTGTENAGYVESYYTLKNSIGTYKNYKTGCEIGKFDYFYYSVQNGRLSDVSFSKVSPEDLAELNICNSADAELASDAYWLFPAKNCHVYIYFPTDKIQNYGDKISFTTNGKMAEGSSPIETTDEPYQIEEIEVKEKEKLYFLYVYGEPCSQEDIKSVYSYITNSSSP